MASGSGSDLYKWKRWSKPATPAPVTKKPNHTNDVQDWIKKVEMASDQAAAITFGSDRSHRHDYTLGGHRTAMATIDVLHDHNEAHTEAQDLLSQWMAEKINFQDDEDDIFHDNFDDDHLTSSRQPHKSDLQNQWESMLEANDPGVVHPYNKMSSQELFHQIETRDDNFTVENILKGMLDKEVVEKSFKKDLGFDATKKKKRDPRVTMDARQKTVKENREKRQLEKEQQLRQKRAQKDTQSEARQMVMKEEQQRALQRQREEALIQHDMAKIRKEMQIQRQTAEETKKRQQQIEERERDKMKLEDEKRREEKALTRLHAQKLLEEERQELLLRARELTAANASEDLKSLQKHFQAWYQLVIHNRLKNGKARAVSDWRCLVHSWNAWKAYTRACRAERDMREAEICIKESHRKRQLAEKHSRQLILHKYFLAWQNWIVSEHQKKILYENREKTQYKMAALLDAAASGKLWTNRSEATIEHSDSSVKKEKSAYRLESDAQHLDDLFSQPVRSQDSATSIQSTARSESSAESRFGGSQRSTGSPSKPKHAWQVTRKHLNLTAEEIATVGDPGPNRNQNNSVPSVSPRPSSEHLVSDRSKRTIQYRANNFEHRYAAQQTILHDQQAQLREQQRLIEDLQTAQKHALLRMELTNLEEGGAGYSSNSSHVREGTESPRSDPGSLIVSATCSDETRNTANSRMSQKSDASRKPTTLKGMDERAELRAKRKAEREERQRKKEDEKLAKMREEEERLKAEEETEKKAKIEKRKEEKRQVKQREIEKQQRLQQIAEQNTKADEHYKKSLMRNYGLKPLRKLLQISHQHTVVATDHHNYTLLKQCVLPWHQYTQDVKKRNMQVAEDQYQYILVRMCWNSWKMFGHYQSILLQKAKRHRIITLKVKTFAAWQDYVTNERIDRWRKEELATQHNIQRIVKRAFQGLRQYPKMVKAEKERERRREEIRKKVASIIPDFGLS